MAMETQNNIFRGQSRRALLISWAALLIPLLLCVVIQIPELLKIKTPGTSLTMPYLTSGLGLGVAASIGAYLVLIFPALYLLRWRGQTSMTAYILTPILWVTTLSALLGLAALVVTLSTGGVMWVQSLFSTLIVSFVLLIVPTLLAAQAYWFLAVRTEGGMRAVTLFSLLFVLWNLYAFLLAGSWAAHMVN